MDKNIHPCPKFIGRQIKYMRKKLKLTQKELAERSSIKLRHFQEIEAGRVNVKVRTIGLISIGLQVTPHFLLTPILENRNSLCSHCQHMIPERI